MLEVFGRGYVVEHCISAFKNQEEEQIYKIYVTDTLKAISEGKHLTDRYYDYIKPKKWETRSADEIKVSILNKLKEM